MTSLYYVAMASVVLLTLVGANAHALLPQARAKTRSPLYTTPFSVILAASQCSRRDLVCLIYDRGVARQSDTFL